MERFVLTDAEWAKMEPHCLGKPSDPGRSGSDNRRFVEAVLWIARTGSPGAIFRYSSATGTRFQALPRLGEGWRFRPAVRGLVRRADMEYAMVDATIVKVDRHGQGAKGGRRTRRSGAPRRHDDQNTRADRRGRQSGSLRPAARPPFRYGRCCSLIDGISTGLSDG